MNKELEEAVERLNKDKNKPLACGDITIVNIDDLEIVLNYIEILETVTNNKYPYVIGGRTLYGRLQQLDKQDLIKSYLRLRNETEQLIKEKENSIPKEIIEKTIEDNAFEVHTREWGNLVVVSEDCLHELLERK